jgi:peptide deformylase
MSEISLHLVAPNDPVLNKIAKPVELPKITLADTQNKIESLLHLAYGEQTDRSKPVLVGLAAPQAGISERIILVDVGADGKGSVSDLRVFINPEITWHSEKTNEWYEGCFSTDRVCGIVTRPTKIRLRAYDKEGNKVKGEYSGYTARIFQHEIDHLNGKEFTTLITDDNNLHWVEEAEFPEYRDKEAWRNWPKKCPRGKWNKIKGIKNCVKKIVSLHY